mmetsp:Transcript_24666/g.79664  ORF Transcript_24666/g.79664 Transcript_24666/m.79664 type:complete len:209 (-) Transcript_24666:752-1378(-)
MGQGRRSLREPRVPPVRTLPRVSRGAARLAAAGTTRAAAWRRASGGQWTGAASCTSRRSRRWATCRTGACARGTAPTSPAARWPWRPTCCRARRPSGRCCGGTCPRTCSACKSQATAPRRWRASRSSSRRRRRSTSSTSTWAARSTSSATAAWAPGWRSAPTRCRASCASCRSSSRALSPSSCAPDTTWTSRPRTGSSRSCPAGAPPR